MAEREGFHSGPPAPRASRSTRFGSRCANLPSQPRLLPWQICEPQRRQPTLLSLRHFPHRESTPLTSALLSTGSPTLARPRMADSERHDVVEDDPVLKNALLKSGGIGVKEVAEREGFEPPRPLRVCRFSKPVQSTTLPSLRSTEVVRNHCRRKGRDCQFACASPTLGL